jgi:transcriptional regulator with XRE-family HTH domain
MTDLLIKPFTPTELQAWRRDYRVSLRDLSRLLGVHKRTIQRWEHGERPMPPYLAPALAGLEKLLLDGLRERASRTPTLASDRIARLS